MKALALSEISPITNHVRSMAISFLLSTIDHRLSAKIVCSEGDCFSRKLHRNDGLQALAFIGETLFRDFFYQVFL